MAKAKTAKVAADWRDMGCVLCTDERNELIRRHQERHVGKRPDNSELPFVYMATAQCRAWVNPLPDQEGREHLIGICDRHKVKHGCVVMCTACAGVEASAPVKAVKPQQASLLEFCESAAA